MDIYKLDKLETNKGSVGKNQTKKRKLLQRKNSVVSEDKTLFKTHLLGA